MVVLSLLLVVQLSVVDVVWTSVTPKEVNTGALASVAVLIRILFR